MLLADGSARRNDQQHRAHHARMDGDERIAVHAALVKLRAALDCKRI